MICCRHLPAGHKKFYRGYDLVDPVGDGFVSQAGTPAERFGTLYNTNSPGNGNNGHLYGTDLSDQDKQRLLAFLKTLLTRRPAMKTLASLLETSCEMVGYFARDLVPGPRRRRVPWRFGQLSNPIARNSRLVPDEAKAAGRTPQTLPAAAKPCSEEPADCSYFARMDKGLLVKPPVGAAYPKEILEVAALTKLTPEGARARSAVRMLGSIGPAATTGSGITPRETPPVRSIC